jgi:hypothetical protein
LLAANPSIQENLMQTGYLGAYRHLHQSRDDKGALIAELHSNGGPFLINVEGRTDSVDAFHGDGQDRPPSCLDSRRRRSGDIGVETSSADGKPEAQDTDGALVDDNPDGNSFDFYVGIASAIGLLLVLIVAVVTALSILLLIQR